MNLLIPFGLLCLLFIGPCSPSPRPIFGKECPYYCGMEWSTSAFDRAPFPIDMIPQLASVEYLQIPNKHHTKVNGIIIDRNMVLTLAEFCEVAEASSFKVRAGMALFRQEVDTYRVVEYLIHPARGRDTYDMKKSNKGYYDLLNMDFCLLRLDHNFKWSSQLQMAALPNVNDTLKPGYLYFEATWGEWDSPNEVRKSPHGHYHQLAGKERCHIIETYTKHPVPYSEDVFCLMHGVKTFASSPTYPNDRGGPIMDPYSMVTVGMLIGSTATPRKGFTPCSNLAFAVDWINEVRQQWVDVNFPDGPVNGTEQVSTEMPSGGDQGGVGM